MDAPIKVIKNFISESEIQKMVEYIDLLEGSVGDEFVKWQDGKRVALQFGEDHYHEGTSHESLELLGDHEELFRDYFSRVVAATKNAFDVAEDLYMTSFWVAKQYPHSIVDSHEDTDNGHNTHFRYSGVLYLNTMTSGGALSFEKYDYSHSPDAGDLVLFPSQGTGNHEVKGIVQERYSLAFWLTDVETMEIE